MYAEVAVSDLEKMDVSSLESVDTESIQSIIEAPEHSLYSSLVTSFLRTLQPLAARDTFNEGDFDLVSDKKHGQTTVTISAEDYLTLRPFLRRWEEVKNFYQTEYVNFRKDIEATPKFFSEVLQIIEEMLHRTEKEQRINILKRRVSILIEKAATSKEILLSSNFSFMSPYDFEEFVAKLFDKMGYKTTTTSKTGDYGVDVVAENDFERVAIQCKKYHEGNSVGNQTVQMLLGAMQLQGLKADRGIIVTTSRFTKQAYRQAESNNLELWDKDILHQAVRKHLIGL